MVRANHSIPSKGILITGTDTGVGKTFVACGIAAALRRRGLRVAPFKPAETGCEWDASSRQLLPADAGLLREASGTDASLDWICPYRFRTPVAPAVAADLEGIPVPAGEMESRLREHYAVLTASADMVIVETAGGILVPLAWGLHYGDLAAQLNLPVLVVAASKLGVLNHTLLTIAQLKSAGLKILGCVLNHCNSERSHATDTNADALRKLLTEPVYVLPQLPNEKPWWNGGAFEEIADQIHAD